MPAYVFRHFFKIFSLETLSNFMLLLAGYASIGFVIVLTISWHTRAPAITPWWHTLLHLGLFFLIIETFVAIGL